SLDSLYGQGIFKSADLGQTWNPIGAGLFDHASFTSMAIDTTTTPGKARIFAGATTGASASRADAAIFESDPSVFGLWFSPDSGASWVHYAESNFANCDLEVLTGAGGPAPCPVDDVTIDPNNPQNV